MFLTNINWDERGIKICEQRLNHFRQTRLNPRQLQNEDAAVRIKNKTIGTVINISYYKN